MTAIFRDGIEPLYEDEKNQDMTIVKFALSTMSKEDNQKKK